MKGDGFYDDHSAPQMATIEAVLPWLEEAVGQMNLFAHLGPLVVADFACSEGRNSIAAAARIIAALRTRDQRPILTIHSDLPSNNFNQLFANLYPAGKRVFSDPDVFSAAVGGSMFDQLIPANTVAVASTYNAIGFLDRRPAVPLPDYILPMGPKAPRPGVEVAPEARRAYAEQARSDLHRFCRARAAELIPGGKLLVASFGVGKDFRANDGIYDVLNDALLDLIASGRLRRESYEQLVFPIYFRTVDELVEPLEDTSAGLSDLFRLDRAESMEVSVPFNQRLAQTGDVQMYAKAYSSFLRAFTEPIIRMAFSEVSDVDSLIGELYARVEARLASDPSGYAFHYIQVAALVTRR
jgi:hypothetical protein